MTEAFPEPVSAPEPIPVQDTPLQETPEATATAQQEGIPRLRTYKADIAQTIRDTNASVVSIAAAESKRRTVRDFMEATVPLQKTLPRSLALASLGVLFVLLGIGALAFVFLDDEPEGVVEITAPVRFIAVDAATTVDMGGMERAALMNALLKLRNETDLALGLVRGLYPVRSVDKTQELVDARAFFSTLAPDIPGALARTLRPEFMIGIHAFDNNQPFLLLTLSSYEQAFAGMLDWEVSLARDLSPLFDRTPRPRARSEATTTPVAAFFLESSFVDRVLYNRDTRALLNAGGDIVLVYVFLDRETLLITTNEHTLQEVVTRLRTPPLP